MPAPKPFKVKPSERKPRPKIAVFLGNVGYASRGEIAAADTKRYAEKHPAVQVHGIDLLHTVPTASNWKQSQIDFKHGLERFEDNSLFLVRSDLSLGHHAVDGGTRETVERRAAETGRSYPVRVQPEKHTRETMEAAYRKLRPGGWLKFSVGKANLETAQKALAATPFNPKKVKIRPPTKLELQRSPWIGKWQKAYKEPVLVVIAQK